VTHIDNFDLDDLAFLPASLSSEAVVVALDGQIAEMPVEIEASELWCILSDARTPHRLVAETLKEIHLEISFHLPLAIEGAVRAIAKFLRQMLVAWWDEMLQYQVEEFDHGEMALRDCEAFGGSEYSALELCK
jgi:hypothetical protein